MFWFLKEVEKQTGRESTDLILNLCHDKANLNVACSATYSLALMEEQ